MDFSGKQIGVLVYSYDAGHLYARVDQIQSRIAILCVVLLAAIIVSAVSQCPLRNRAHQPHGVDAQRYRPRRGGPDQAPGCFKKG